MSEKRWDRSKFSNLYFALRTHNAPKSMEDACAVLKMLENEITLHDFL